MELNSIHRNVVPRKKWLALLLSGFIPGLGQVYNGQLRRGIVYFIIGLFFLALVVLFRFVGSIFAQALFFLPSVAIRILSGIDAYRAASVLVNYQLKSYNKGWIYLATILLIGGTVFFLQGSPISKVGFFIIPSTSNMPTLMQDDYIMADFNYYKHLKVDYGHLIVFNHTKQHWLYRVVGMPGDKLTLDNNFLFVNNKALETTYLGDTTVTEYYEIPPGFPGEGTKQSFKYNYAVYSEALPNGHQHSIYINKDDTIYANRTVDFSVPQNFYFVMGDNRNAALDSRYIGPIRKEDVEGRLVKCIWGAKPGRFNIDLTTN